MKNTYRTAQVAKIVGIHPNTVRLYEDLDLISKPERLSNGYRVFTDFHIEQFRLARTALKVEVLQSGLRKNIIHIIKLVANREFQKAIACTNDYINQVKKEQKNAEEAIEITRKLLSGTFENQHKLSLTRKQAAQHLLVTIDTLRNWELNGLFTVKRKENGYRVYTDEDMNQLKIIRSLRCANYSLEAILRMLRALSRDPNANIKQLLDTPRNTDDIISVCDKLITSLQAAEKNALDMLLLIEIMKEKF